MTYTHGHHESVLRSHRWRTAENSAGHLLPLLRPGQTLLDVGCGPGTITLDLAERLAPGRVTAVEPTESALELARAEAERRRTDRSRTAQPSTDRPAKDGPRGAAARGTAPEPVVEFAVTDVHALDFPDDSFDIVHAHQVLQHVADPVQALREMRRVCKPGGVVAARDSDYAAFTWYPASPELDRWLRLYQLAARANGGEPDAGRRLLAWAHAAGFADVQASSSTWCFATPADRDWWGGMWADRILQSALARQLLDSGQASADELARISQAWRDWAAADDGWLSLLHGEILCRV